jgi:hypothetical protein
MNAASWNLALGDSVTRVMVYNYGDVPPWNDWRRFTQQVYGLNFRTQPRDQVGGYGILTRGEPGRAVPAVHPAHQRGSDVRADQAGRHRRRRPGNDRER